MKKALLKAGLVCAAAVSASALTSCGGINLDDGVMRIGVVCIGTEGTSYDINFMNALNSIKNEQDDVEVLYKLDVDEDGEESYEAAVKLAQAGCDIIIGNSYGFEDNIIKAAKKYPKHLFAHCSGDKAHTEKLDNYCNGFASIYEGRYLAGIAAGMKLNEMGETKLGYVGAYPFAEVISGYTAFYLGAKSVCKDVTMDVQFTEDWSSEQLEHDAANNLISKGAKIVSQHADTYGAPEVCDGKDPKVPNVAYNVSTQDLYPDSYLCYSSIWWKPFFEQLITWRRNGEKPNYDFTGTLANGGVRVGAPGNCAANKTQEKMDLAKEELINGTRKVFDCKNFTYDGGKKVTTWMADVDNYGDFASDTQVIKIEGELTYFDESSFRSAPYFAIDIDGINIIG